MIKFSFEVQNTMNFKEYIAKSQSINVERNLNIKKEFLNYLCHTEDHRGGVVQFCLQVHYTLWGWECWHKLGSDSHECNDMLLCNNQPGREGRMQR